MATVANTLPGNGAPLHESLLKALDILAIEPPSWEADSHGKSDQPRIHPDGVAKYLTSIIASKILWIHDDVVKEQIWEKASTRLSERSGRTGMPAVSRTFRIPTQSGNVGIVLHEPSLTADNLGLKTWASSYLLAKRLHMLELSELTPGKERRVLELGSGTGLVGIAAAAVWGTNVHLTDLPEIEPNLTSNVQANQDIILKEGGVATTGVLDWADTTNPPSEEDRYPIILAADPLYSPEHPALLVQTIERYLLRYAEARVMVELPLREAYAPEIADFKQRMHDIGLEISAKGEEVGYDDWGGGNDGGLKEVRCWWGVWAWKHQQFKPC
ncbi:MAG: hypothetical protein M1830_006126 [Pleopsidium flavum]|nr:MAG: hypothetical protein M1830_006126 [Pleopsidium flavum]